MTFNTYHQEVPSSSYEPTTNTNFSPRRFGVAPLSSTAQQQQKAQSMSSFSPSQPTVLATRLTQKELKEPLGHSPIRGTGKARFGIMETRSENENFVAGKVTPRGDSVLSLLQNQFSSSPLSASSSNNNNNSARRSYAGGDASSSTIAPDTGRSLGSTQVITGEEGSPRKSARHHNMQTTFSALPGGSESLQNHRFGKIVPVEETVKSIVTPRYPETHVTASPEKMQSRRRFFHNNNNSNDGATTTRNESTVINTTVGNRVDPSALPAACKPTAEGVMSKAAFPAVISKDSVKNILDSTGDLQTADQARSPILHHSGRGGGGLKPSSTKVNEREAPPSTLASPRRRTEAYEARLREQEEAHQAEKAFGSPTLRKDLSPPTSRKLTDPKNYGDELSSGDLVLGGNHALMGRLMNEKSLKSADDAVAWSNRCVFGLTEEEARYVFIAASESTKSDSISLQEFKKMVDLLFP